MAKKDMHRIKDRLRELGEADYMEYLEQLEREIEDEIQRLCWNL